MFYYHYKSLKNISFCHTVSCNVMLK